jgi:hypothetical protein
LDYWRQRLGTVQRSQGQAVFGQYQAAYRGA